MRTKITNTRDLSVHLREILVHDSKKLKVKTTLRAGKYLGPQF